jgi:hypothetical protein
MDRYGNAGTPDRKFRAKLAHAIGPGVRRREEQKPTPRLHVANVPTKDHDKIRRDCGLCGREGLNGFVAYWSHLKDAHPAEIERLVSQRSTYTPETERFEAALIRIVNATSLEDACEIATEALMRGES